MKLDPNCKICSDPLPVERQNGRKCVKCYLEGRRAQYRRDKEVILGRQRLYFRKNREEIYRKNRDRTKRLSQEKPLMMSFYQAKSRSKKLGIPFSISFQDIPEVPEVCPVLGIPILCNTGKRTDNSPSLDKIVPSLGYIPGNIAVISFRANSIKGYASLQELRQVVAFLEDHHGSK